MDIKGQGWTDEESDGENEPEQFMYGIQEEVATAWKVIRTEPIVLRLRFSLSQYLDGPEPSVEVFQPSTKEGFSLGLQLKKILSTFTSQQWKHLSNEFLKAQQEKRHSWFKAGGTIKKFRAGLSIFSPIPKAADTARTFPTPGVRLSSWQIMKYSEQRIPTLNEYCVVCDEQHVFQNGSMLKGSYLEIKKQMDKLDPLAHPLLQWIISSNRSHIVKLPLSRQLKFMHTSHQFLLLSSPPAKEARFRTAKKLYGSTFAFHSERVTLSSSSSLSPKLHGAAYGKGIYLSPISSISFGYSVITSKDLQKHGNIWVCPVSDHVCTRFFFVYEDGQVGDANINTQEPKIQKEIMRVIGTQIYSS
ncbi:hypothetical protein cypCar_00026835 [Cyprinus carpio]|nr:hypothetical protein cypCar_00026835 [Cyprinus carpio]